MLAVTTEKRRRCRSLWTVLPHVSLISSLVVYGCFGALVFWRVERQGAFDVTGGEYGRFLELLVAVVRTGNCSDECLLKKVDGHITAQFKSVWLQRPQRWTFLSSLFFCCTVFTTVGSWNTSSRPRR